MQAGVKAPTKKLVKTRGKVESVGTPVWSYMQTEHHFKAEQLVNFRQALTSAKIHGNKGTLVRVFAAPSEGTKRVAVEDFDSLNEHPELILYEGYYYGHSGPGEILIEKRTGSSPSLLEREFRDGGITEVGLKEEPSASKKWLGRIGKFLMYGGWMLIMVIVVAVIILIQVLTK